MTADAHAAIEAAVERVTTFLDAWDAAGLSNNIRFFEPDPMAIPAHMEKLVGSDLRTILAALKQLTPRTVSCPVCHRPTKLTATGLIRYHGPHNRPCKGSSILPEVPDDATPHDAALAARDQMEAAG